MYIQHTELYMYNLLYICSPPHVYFKHKEYIIPLYVLSACMYILVFVHTYLRTGLDAPDPCVVGGPHPVYARLIYIPAASHLTYDMYSDKSIISYCRKNLHNAVALRKDNRIPLPTEKQGQRARTNLWESQNQRFGFLWPCDRTTCHFSLSQNRLCAYAFGYAWGFFWFAFDFYFFYGVRMQYVHTCRYIHTYIHTTMYDDR